MVVEVKQEREGRSPSLVVRLFGYVCPFSTLCKVVRSLVFLVTTRRFISNRCLRRSTMVRTRQTAKKLTGGTAPRKTLIKRNRKTAPAPPGSNNDVVMTVADPSQVSQTNGIWRVLSVNFIIGLLLYLLERRRSLRV